MKQGAIYCLNNIPEVMQILSGLGFECMPQEKVSRDTGNLRTFHYEFYHSVLSDFKVNIETSIGEWVAYLMGDEYIGKTRIHYSYNREKLSDSQKEFIRNIERSLRKPKIVNPGLPRERCLVEDLELLLA